MAVKPAAEHHVALQAAGHAGDVNKHKLRHVLCQMRVAIHEPDRGGICQVEISRHDFAKGGLRAALRVFRQQSLAFGHFQLSSKDPPTRKTAHPDLIFAQHTGN